MPIVSFQIIAPALMAFERELLESVFTPSRATTDPNGAYPVRCVATWIDDLNQIQTGPVRWGMRGNIHPGARDSVSASPFTGAWSMVPLDRIVRVRSVSEVSNG